MSREKQIEEMAKVMCGYYGTEKCYDCRYCCDCHIKHEADRLYNAGYRKQSEGEWLVNWRSTFPQYEPSEYECSICGYKRTVLHNYCPNCGARMKGGE